MYAQMSMTRQTGLTLLELVVSLLVMTILTSVAITSVQGIQEQARYEKTKERLAAIRKAILGDPSRTVNGQPMISGFVADMGRLPYNLHELLEQNFCSKEAYTDPISCTTNGGTWYPSTPWSVDSTTGLGYGWRGPYLMTNESPNSPEAFTDGWGNNGTQETNNYGWHYSLQNSELSLYSVGGPESPYNQQFPGQQQQPYIKKNNWLVDVGGGIQVTISRQTVLNGLCGFKSTASGGSYPNQQSCEDAGGTWSGTSCTLDASSCKGVGGKWQTCLLTSTACANAGGTAKSGCHFGKKACSAIGGTWSNNNTCQFTSTQCANAGGVWDSTTSTCSFTEQTCSLSGGVWLLDCQFASSSCGAAGGTWNSTAPASCAFTYSQCTAINGVSTGDDCHMSHAEYSGQPYTPTSCQTAGGNWTNRICLNVFYRDPNAASPTITHVSSEPVGIDMGTLPATVRFTLLDTNDIDQDGDTTEPLPYLPIGLNAIGIYEYDGDCDPINNPPFPAGKTPQWVPFLPNTQPIINW